MFIAPLNSGIIKLLIVALLWAIPSWLLAQTATEEALDKACNCFESIDFSSLPFDQLDTKTDSCLQEALYTNLTGVLKENQATLDDNDAMFRLAQIIEKGLLMNCLGFQVFSKRSAERRVAEIKQKHPSATGLLYEMNTDGQFPILKIITEDYEILEFIWFREFDGSTRFMKGIKDYKNTVVEIVWQDLELYDAEKQRYPFYKEILLIEEVREVDNKARKAWVKAVKRGK